MCDSVIKKLSQIMIYLVSVYKFVLEYFFFVRIKKKTSNIFYKKGHVNFFSLKNHFDMFGYIMFFKQLNIEINVANNNKKTALAFDSKNKSHLDLNVNNFLL